MGKSLSKAYYEIQWEIGLMMKRSSSVVFKKREIVLLGVIENTKNWKGLSRNQFMKKGISYAISWIMSILRDRRYVKKLTDMESSFRYFYIGRISYWKSDKKKNTNDSYSIGQITENVTLLLE